MVEVLFGFSKSTKKFPLVGWLIELFQKGKYSHSFIRLWVPEQSLFVVIDATSHGVRVRSWEEFSLESRMVKGYSGQVDAQQALKLFWWGILRSGQHYPKLEVAGNALQLAVKYLSFGKLQINNPFKEGSKKPRCNELSALALREVFGLSIEENLDNVDLIWLDNFLGSKVPWITKANEI